MAPSKKSTGAFVCALAAFSSLRYIAHGQAVTTDLGTVTMTSAPGDVIAAPRWCPVGCKCKEESRLIDCSKRKLKVVPGNLPPDTRILFLSRNKIQNLTDRDFRNLTDLRVLDLAYNEINVTDSDVFSGLHNLRSLNLSYNPLPKLADGFFSPLSRLVVLNMTSTRVEFNPTVFLNASNLEIFDFRRNRLFKFPHFLYRNRSVFPRLVELHLQGNSLESFNSYGLDTLEKLFLTYNKINALHPYTLAHFKRLKHLNLVHNFMGRIGAKSFCSETLERLDLAFTEFQLTERTKDVFKCTPNLADLSLVYCKISVVRGPFQKLHKLRKLNIGSTGVSEQHIYKLFRNVTSLEWLSMQGNAIHYLQENMFRNVAGALKVLLVGGNRITTVNISSLPAKLWNSLERLDLSGNPFDCDCQLTWFLNWLNTTNVTIQHWKDPYQYRCYNSGRKKVPLRNIARTLVHDCFIVSQDWYFVTVMIMVLATYSSSTVASLLYRFRWYVKYWYFKYQIQKRREHESSDSRCYSYDAFVTYSKHDTQWVVNDLRRHLETTFGLRLCIHDRDFVIGEDIVHNVIQSIETSRKILLVVSNHFALSQWCHFELSMAQTRILESDRDNLVLILLEEVHESNIPPRLKLQMQKQTYLEWTEDTVGQQLFWERLRQALGKPNVGVASEPLPRRMFGPANTGLSVY